jgi:sulfur relay (sulfurtransferase) complex TusBCD TusD component (DsrE family)
VAVATQGFADVQVAFWAQAVQVPPGAQTWSSPQLVPAATKDVATQTGAPVEHCVVAAWTQGLVEVQAAPSVQAVQTPVGEQTWSWPQEPPAGT